MASLTATVFRIPDEITEHTLTLLHPIDIANFSQTCHSAYTLVYGAPDQYLWHQLFLAYPFDNPINTLNYQNTNTSYNWRNALQRRVQAELIASNIVHRLEEQQFALETFISVIGDASPPLEHKEASESIKWVIHILHGSRILDAHVTLPSPTDIQLISCIRTYLALSFEEANNDEAIAHFNALRTRSQCLVYNIRNYRRDNNYGPFLRGGQINWVQAEAIINVMQPNLMELNNLWIDTRPPYSSDSHSSHNPSFFNDPNIQESTRLKELKLHLVPVSSTLHDYVSVSPRNSLRSPRFPNLYFLGISKGTEGDEATVKGSVSMGNDRVVRWRFVSLISHFISEGIQIGNVGSAAGIIGSWTGATHDHGPFWLWKVPDDHPSHISDPN
ncbi:hypothetical protein PILCRDRAFT_789242 [Piloderma croceum F 1598]|uniref:F-box domain-containing protein n=1 Tax=Piloderma croceum (strain F 1598) TaxID=765440 RepID=A0A0C3BT49_PILCF|nr:hypothetical protein PILCRDRAFT_789242 [Piloderma croceum F 1598]